MDDLTVIFEEQRTHLRAVAYRLVGSVHQADDAVQETWLRLERSDVSNVDNLPAWLTTVVSRICLDQLRSRASRHEDLSAEPIGLPDELVTNPAAEAEHADAVGRALMVVLDTLAPAERLAFCLHDLFGLSFDEIAPALGRSSAACRQLASRARRRLRRVRRSRSTGPGSARWSRRSWTPPVMASSTGCWHCCTPRRWCPLTRPPWRWAHRRCSRGPTRWRGCSPGAPRPPASPTLTGTPRPSGPWAARSRPSSRSPSRTA
jgi:RNA polymerase sigma factor (sigma-70 family)